MVPQKMVHGAGDRAAARRCRAETSVRRASHMSADQLWKCARALHAIATLARTAEQRAALDDRAETRRSATKSTRRNTEYVRGENPLLLAPRLIDPDQVHRPASCHGSRPVCRQTQPGMKLSSYKDAGVGDW